MYTTAKTQPAYNYLPQGTYSIRVEAESAYGGLDTTPGNIGTAVGTYPFLNGDFCTAKDPQQLGKVYWCWTLPQEELNFQVNFPVTDYYTFGYLYATARDTASMSVFVDGIEVFGPLSTPNTLGWETFSAMKSYSQAVISAGVHNVRLSIKSGGFNALTGKEAADPINIDYFEFMYNTLDGTAPGGATNPTTASTTPLAEADPTAEQVKTKSGASVLAATSALAAVVGLTMMLL
jgi:hypothetical protein